MKRLAATARLAAHLVGCVVGALSLNGCGPADEAAPSVDVITVSVSACGAGFAPIAGAQTLVVHNADSRPGEVRIVRATAGELGTQPVLAEIEPLADGATRTLHVDLPSGRLQVLCLMEDEPVVASAVHRVPGDATGARAIVPISQADLIPATQAYQRWVQRQLPALVAQVSRLRDAVAAGDVQGARAAWLAAHSAYERLGAAYDAFGDLDAVINDPRGSAGFHAVERRLWRGDLGAATQRTAATLATDVRRLRTQLGSTRLDPLTLAIRVHEISENSLQFQLNGLDDFGSHAAWATLSASLDGSREVWRLVRPLARRSVDVREIDRLLDDAGRALHEVPAGLRQRPIEAMPVRMRGRLDAAWGVLCERLADVAEVLEPRRTS